jgi:hypothetical protein
VKRCENCGKTYNDKMKFCVVCGSELIDGEAVLEEAVVEETHTEETIAEETVTDESIAEETVAEETHAEETVAEETHAEEFHSIETHAVDTHNEESIETETFKEEQIVHTHLPDEAENLTEIPIREVKPKITVRRVIAALCSAILGAVCLALLLTAGVSYTARFLTYGDTIESIVTSVDVLYLPIDDTPMGEAGETVIEAVYTFSDGMGLSEEDIADIYEDATFRDELISLMTMYADFIRTGIYPVEVTTETIKGIFEENVDVINRVLERAGEPPLNEIDHAMALASIESAESFLKSISFENLSRSDRLINPMGVLRIAISFPMIIGEIALAVILLVIIGAISKSVRTPLLVGGITAMLSGGVIASVLYLIENSALIVIENNAAQIILSSVTRYVGAQMYGICGIAAGAGLIMIIISQVRIRKHKQVTV